MEIHMTIVIEHSFNQVGSFMAFKAEKQDMESNHLLTKIRL